MDTPLGPVAPVGRTGVAPGLVRGTACDAERIAYTVGERVRQRCLRVPQTRFVLTDAAFELRSSCMAWIGAYVGSPSIGGIVGF